MIAGAPNLLALPFEHWASSWSIDSVGAFYCLLYLWGMWRVRRWSLPRAVSFCAGVLVVLAALQSGIDSYDDRLLSDHMVQHLLLLLLAPPLLLQGQPLTLALRALAPPRRRELARLLAKARALTNPYLCVALFSAVLLVTHLSAFYEATLRHPSLHQLEHAIFLIVGLLFWTPLLDAAPVSSRRLGGFGRLVYVLAAMPSMAVIGVYLNRAQTLVYPVYGPAARALGVSALTDQARAGAIMWVGGGVFMVAIGLWVAMSTMSEDERRQRTREELALAREAGPRARVSGL
jgi:putative copper resistance protein D